VKGKIYRGVLTGLNEAFVIDTATRNRLIAEDPRSAEVIKPFLAGRDIKRYQEPKSDKFLIFTKRGIDINAFPAIKNHLLQFKKQLMPKPKDLQAATLPDQKEQLKARIDHTDDKINRMVYQLYGLTEEEIAVVEHTG